MFYYCSFSTFIGVPLTSMCVYICLLCFARGLCGTSVGRKFFGLCSPSNSFSFFCFLLICMFMKEDIHTSVWVCNCTWLRGCRTFAYERFRIIVSMEWLRSKGKILMNALGRELNSIQSLSIRRASISILQDFVGFHAHRYSCCRLNVRSEVAAFLRTQSSLLCNTTV